MLLLLLPVLLVLLLVLLLLLVLVLLLGLVLLLVLLPLLLLLVLLLQPLLLLLLLLTSNTRNDIDAKDLTGGGMEEVVRQSKFVLIFLSAGIHARPASMLAPLLGRARHLRQGPQPGPLY